MYPKGRQDDKKSDRRILHFNHIVLVKGVTKAPDRSSFSLCCHWGTDIAVSGEMSDDTLCIRQAFWCINP
jgi:hypothetical protein